MPIEVFLGPQKQLDEGDIVFSLRHEDVNGDGNSLDFSYEGDIIDSRLFLDLNLNRVGLEVLADNTAAIKLYEKSGFALDGRLRSAAFKNGRSVDVLTMGILAADFLGGASGKMKSPGPA